MSRSVHATRRELEEVRRWEFGGSNRRDDEVWLVQDRLAAKRRYKRRAAGHRAVTGQGSDARSVEVVTEPAVEHVHHPLSSDDIQALLGLLPADVRPTLRAVCRRTGLREDDMVAEHTEPDPLTGRHGYERDGGIWAPRLRGRFRPAAGEIDLYAFVYDERALRVPEVQTVLLWLDQAETLAHEVAHAWDDSGRSSGDRWAMDEDDRAERYAEEAALEWTGQYAAAYFEHAHPERARAYHDWIHRNVGIPIPLARVADDLDRGYSGVHIGLYDVCAAWTDAAALDLRTELAREFHYVDDYEPARRILALVLSEAPEHPGATILMGDIAVHEQDWDRALDWTDRALRVAPHDLDAHEDRVDALVGAERWDEAAAAAGRRLAMGTPYADAGHARIRLDRARCLIELGDYSGADVDLDAVAAGGVYRYVAVARAVRAESLLERDRLRAARAEAMDALRTGASGWAAALLTAVAWVAATRLGDASTAHIPTEEQVDLLRWNARSSLVDRMVEMGMKPRGHHLLRREAALRRRWRSGLTRL